MSDKRVRVECDGEHAATLAYVRRIKTMDDECNAANDENNDRRRDIDTSATKSPDSIAASEVSERSSIYEEDDEEEDDDNDNNEDGEGHHLDQLEEITPSRRQDAELASASGSVDIKQEREFDQALTVSVSTATGSSGQPMSSQGPAGARDSRQMFSVDRLVGSFGDGRTAGGQDHDDGAVETEAEEDEVSESGDENCAVQAQHANHLTSRDDAGSLGGQQQRHTPKAATFATSHLRSGQHRAADQLVRQPPSDACKRTDSFSAAPPAASQNLNQNQHQGHGQNQSQPGNADYEDVKHVDLFGVKIVALTINAKERLCLAQISNTLLKDFSYNEIHNRRVALGITCVQCTPIQLEMLRRAGAMPSSSRRCGMITMREAERLCRSFLAEEQPPELPENFYFTVGHRVNYGCKGRFIPARYISSRAKCIECFHCGEFYSPNKFIFHSHKQPGVTDCNPPDSPNINSWRKHINLDWTVEHSQEIKYAWEDVKSLFNGGTRRRATGPLLSAAGVAASTPGPGSAVAAVDAVVAGAGAAVGELKSDQEAGQEFVKSRQPTADDKLANKRRGKAALHLGQTQNLHQHQQHHLQHYHLQQQHHHHKNHQHKHHQHQHQNQHQYQQQQHQHKQQQRLNHYDERAKCSPGPVAPMSQSERRKLPMGWPVAPGANGGVAPHINTRTGLGQHSAAQPVGVRHPLADNVQAPPTGSGPDPQCSLRNNSQSPPAPPATKRFLSTSNWHTPRSAMGHSRQTASSPYGPGVVAGCDPLRSGICDQSEPGRQVYVEPAGRQQHNFLNEAQGISDLTNDTGALDELTRSAPPPYGSVQTSLAGYSVPPTAARTQTPGPPPQTPTNTTNFIYSQLYSHLMQSRLAQQQIQQQQQQISPLDAQVALRHHIWSSLLANLRCNSTADALNHQRPGNYVTGHQQVDQRNDLMSGCLGGQTSVSGQPLAPPPPPPPPPQNTSSPTSLGFNALNTMIPLIYNGIANPQLSGPADGLATLFAVSTEQANKEVCKQ